MGCQVTKAMHTSCPLSCNERIYVTFQHVLEAVLSLEWELAKVKHHQTSTYDQHAEMWFYSHQRGHSRHRAYLWENWMCPVHIRDSLSRRLWNLLPSAGHQWSLPSFVHIKEAATSQIGHSTAGFRTCLANQIKIHYSKFISYLIFAMYFPVSHFRSYIFLIWEIRY